MEEIPYFDAIDYVQLDENDKLYDMRYMGAYGEISYSDEMPSSYLIRFNTFMEIDGVIDIAGGQ